MSLPIYLPNMKQGSTKDYIIRVLTLEKSISNQKILNQIRQQFGVSVTYQTVRQALLELVQGGILEKIGKEYQISISWIKSMDDYIKLLKKKYVEGKEVIVIDENTKEITLNSLAELGFFILNSFHNYFFDRNSKDELYIYVHHLWWPFSDKNKRNELKEFFTRNNKNLVYVGGNGFVDQLFSLFYKKYCKVKLGLKLDEFFDFIIQGDCIAKIYMPKELRQRMDKVYKKKILTFNLMDEFVDFTGENYSIKIIITRNKELVTEMKDILEKK